jgi:hypothetical protein
MMHILIVILWNIGTSLVMADQHGRVLEVRTWQLLFSHDITYVIRGV